METICITLTTDFGLKDGFVGAMKGVISSICPRAQLIDISHDISPQNILEGARVLFRAYSYFPAGTVHLAVVDPGVGTSRRPVAARLGDYYFVGPDNGLFTPVLEAIKNKKGAIEFVQLSNPKYWLPDVSSTFHGRDIFAPVAAYLAKGVLLSELGPVIRDPVRLAFPNPERTDNGWRAHITSIDHFGNLATDLSAVDVPAPEKTLFRLHDREIHGLVTSYGQNEAGALIALVNSEGFIEIAVVNGSAAHLSGALIGDVVEVFLRSKVE